MHAIQNILLSFNTLDKFGIFPQEIAVITNPSQITQPIDFYVKSFSEKLLIFFFTTQSYHVCTIIHSFPVDPIY